ncbi:MAG: DnaA/Hda family protein [Hyphomicrobiaceae bacterium]
MAAPEQLVLDLGHRTALGAEDFLVGHSNAAAVALVDSWPHWPAPSVLVTGPPRSGKTHLAHVWRAQSGAPIVSAAGLTDATVGQLGNGGALVVEDLHAGIACERTLFHLLNVSREHRASLLLTSAVPPGDLSVVLPDLRSRLRASMVVEIAASDDGLLRAVLVKHFTDRQLSVDPSVVAWLLVNMDRTMADAACVVDAIDRLALASRRKVTRALASEALARLRGPNAEPRPIGRPKSAL